MKHYVYFSQQADTEAQAVSRRLRTVVRKEQNGALWQGFCQQKRGFCPWLAHKCMKRLEARVGFEPRRLIART
jgi:hypothetical protein